MTKTSIGSPEPDDNLPQVRLTWNGQTYSYIPGGVVTTSSTGPHVKFTANEMIINGTIQPEVLKVDAVMSGTIDAGAVTAHKIETTQLFGRWIKDTKTLQEQFYGKNFEDFSHQELVDWVRINVLAAEDELHETLGEISWKPWAKSEFFNREAYLGEIVDVLHFVGNLLAGAGITDEELNAAYLEKMERNRERQRKGYTGLDKCSSCGRAADDVTAHGGYMREWIQGQPDTVHSTGYGCNACFCDPGDDYK